MGGVDKIELGKGRKAIKAYLETPRAPGRARRLHPVLRPPLPAERQPGDYLYYLDLKEKMFGMKKSIEV